ncbi:nuclear transport factor 2 family protein [Stieleria sp. TO1_6]|uniref:YybH family protein n=1 Tax=Stieleria tagensis TaxID=2956795 RepID=UPI00209AE11A|nr:nuclear transport factor 2 family protein [Stieleria tagensis]MCO8122670.1 nuclear transport factor 2 family protein [Stieleria tagensis]
MKKTTLVGLLLTLFVSPFAFAQESDPPPPEVAPTPANLATSPSDPSLDEIRVGSEAFVKAFNEGNAASIAQMWTQQGEYVDSAGNRFVGPKEIEAAYADFFGESSNATLQLKIDSLTALSDTAAIERGTSLVEVPPAATITGRYEAIHVKVDGKWKMASVRDVVVQTNLATQNLADLEFLVGHWVAEEHGNKIESVCSWVGDHRFVKRDYTTTNFDGTQSSGVQLIGWNPQGGSIQSWTFSPDGGHAIGIWTPTPDGWAAEMEGMTGSGAPTTSVNLLHRLDDNAYVWQSVNRTIDGVALDDTNEVVIKRQP